MRENSEWWQWEPEEPTKLKPEVKEAWIAELASDRWVKWCDSLGQPDTNARCCLGVLHEVVAPGEVMVLMSGMSYPSHTVTQLAFQDYQDNDQQYQKYLRIYQHLANINDDNAFESWKVKVIPWIKENL